MLVDDDPTEVFFFEEALEYNGANLDIIFETSAHAELKRLESVRPNFVILDVRMPGISGFDVLIEIRNRRELATTPIFMISNSVSESERRKALDLGAQNMFAKPISPDGYYNMVSEILLDSEHGLDRKSA
jgi:DNA-binding response OmpR family regulator